MVWKSPLRQHSRSDSSETSSSPSTLLLTSPAENQVREIASRIGLFEDSQLLATVCQKMRKEYVIEEWQLPALDSRQWEKLHAPIGLAVAVRHISTHQLREQRSQLPQRLLEEEKEEIANEEGRRKHSNDSFSIDSYEDNVKTRASSSIDPSKEKEEDRSKIIPKAMIDESSLETTTNQNIQYESVEDNSWTDFDRGDGVSGISQAYSTTKTTGTVQAMVDSINDKIVEDKIEATKVETESVNSLEWGKPTTPIANRDIWRTKNSGEISKLETGSKATEEVEEERGVSKVEITLIQSAEIDGVKILEHVEPKVISCTGMGDRRGIDIISPSMQVEEILEKEEANVTERDEPPESSSSESESEGNTNIFSDIGNSVSFSEDEDESPAISGTRDLACLLGQMENMEDSAISTSHAEPDLLMIPDNDADDITVGVSNVSPEGRNAASKRKKQTRKYRHEYDRENSSFEIETSALTDILVQLPDDDHRAILSQLMIMTNARNQDSRTTLAFQVQDSLVSFIENNGIDMKPEKAVQLIFHLSRLKKSYRMAFGKSLFKAMSKLYKRTERLNTKNYPKKKGEKNDVQDGHEMDNTGMIKDIKTPVDGVVVDI